jgi:uncharacterized membrane protein
MSEVLAAAFDDLNGADDALHKLRSLEADHLVELDDACIAQSDGQGRLHLKQAIGHRLPDALHGRFWHELVQHFLHHGRQPESAQCRSANCTLDRAFCCDLAEALKPGTSALFVLARQASAEALVQALREHKSHILRSTLPEHEQEEIEVAIGTRPPRPPSASELQAMIVQEEEHEAAAAQHKREAARARRRQEIERFAQGNLSPDDIRAIVQRCTDAAQAGHDNIIAYRFPSEVCLDGGRAINNGEHDWPASLNGQPRAVYEYWQRVLRPAGYHISARILNYPGGVPGDVGFILSWAPYGA